MNSSIVIYAGLFVATAIYARLLALYKKRLEPDWTWMEVVIGCAMCLLAADIRTRQLVAPTWQDYESSVWLAFVVGGIPIVIWQASRLIRRHNGRLPPVKNGDLD